jgi:hypothetical protein
MVQQSKSGLKFNTAWTFPYEVEQRIAEIVNAHPGNWLHAPVGISKIGLGPFGTNIDMETLDINPLLKPDHVCDIFKMPEYFKGRKFDGVISDPIWYTKDKKATIGLAYPQRRHLSYAVRDILKPGGIFIFNGLWNPIVKGLKLQKVEVPMQQFSSFRNVSLLITLKKINETL